MERHKLEVVVLGATLQRHRSSSSEALLCPGPMLRRPCAHTAGDRVGSGVSASRSVAHKSRSLGCLFSRLAEFQREICTLNKNSLHLNAGSGLRRILKLPVFVFQGQRSSHFHCGKSHLRWRVVPSKLCQSWGAGGMLPRDPRAC